MCREGGEWIRGRADGMVRESLSEVVMFKQHWTQGVSPAKTRRKSLRQEATTKAQGCGKKASIASMGEQREKVLELRSKWQH